MMSSRIFPVESMLFFTDNHDDWLCALMTDDVDTVQYMVNNCDEETKNILLGGWISDKEFWQCCNSHDVNNHQITAVQRPWCLAAVCGSCKVVAELYKAGIDVSQLDKMGNNIIHSLIIYASRQHELLHLDMYNYIASLVPHNKLISLLLTENTDGLRPVELAAHFHTLRLLDAILKTPGLYLSRKVCCATLCMNYYDVTDYESLQDSRPKTRNLLFLLTFLRNNKLADPYTKEAYTSGLIGQWIAYQKKVFMPLILMWLFFRTVLLLLALFPTMTSVDDGSRNCGIHLGFPRNVSLVTPFILVVFATLSIVYDMLEISRFGRASPHWMKKYVPIKGNLVVRYYFYRICQFLNNLGIFVSCINKIAAHYWEPILPAFVDTYMAFMVAWGLIWSLLFFVQLSPIFGTYVIATQRMLLNLIRFSFIILIFFLPSAIMLPRMISVDENGNCPIEFNSFSATFYTTFTVFLNMVDLKSFKSPSMDGLQLFHVGFVIMIAVLLLNFLIAIFSNSYDEVSSHKEVIHSIQWLSVTTTIDYRIPNLLRPLLDKLKRRYFFYSEGRVYIGTFEIAKRQ